MYIGINIILAVSLNLVSGFAGQFSMGHAGFMAVGAYVSALTTMTFLQWYPHMFAGAPASEILFGASIVIGGLAAAFFGYVVGIPSLRLRGDYLAIVTLGFGEIIRVALLNIELVGGARGLPGIPAFTSVAWVYSCVLICLLVIIRLIDSARGRAIVSVRDDEIASAAVGINAARMKVQAFAIAAFFAGVAGALFAHKLRYLNPATFDFNRSVEVIVMVVLGGLGSISGSVIAAIVLTALREVLRSVATIGGTDYRMIIYAALMIGMMIIRPGGMFGSREIGSLFAGRFSRFKIRKPRVEGTIA